MIESELIGIDPISRGGAQLKQIRELPASIYQTMTDARDAPWSAISSGRNGTSRLPQT